ncbi:DsrE/DsrF/DrsH-like family protein [Nitriliruptoria bacterium AS10]|nr:DsrE/DsrF/DrsH-like family protein [Salsipaludibacter albus]
MPDFGDPAPADNGTTPATATATAATATSTGPRRMAFICSKGNLDMAYPALIVGNAALTEGVEVLIFFTFWGLDMINTQVNDKLKFTVSGNTAMHMPDLAKVRPGLEYKAIPQALGNLPGMTAYATRHMKEEMDKLGVPPVPEFLDLLAASGAHLYACKLSYDMAKMIEADLHPAVEGVITAADFVELAEGAQIVFI